MGLGYGDPPPKGFRVASDEHGNSIDPFSGAERAARRKEAEDARLAENEARRQAKESGEDTFTPTPLHGDPNDILDAAVLAVAAEPWRMHGSGPEGGLVMDTPAAKRQRERQRLDSERAKVEKTIARASGDVVDDEDEDSAYQQWVREGLRLDKTAAQEEDERYKAEEEALERELEEQAGW
jgi:hypothetical protein